MNRHRFVRWALVLATVTFALVTGTSAYNDCTASVKGDLMRTEVGRVETTLAFKVDISVQEECATVYYELVTEEQTPDGETEVKKKSLRTRLRNGQTSKGVKFQHRNENKLIRWSFDIVECRKCE